MATSAPASANAWTMAAPMPREPPVTRATRPVRWDVMRGGLRSEGRHAIEALAGAEPPRSPLPRPVRERLVARLRGHAVDQLAEANPGLAVPALQLHCLDWAMIRWAGVDGDAWQGHRVHVVAQVLGLAQDRGP